MNPLYPFCVYMSSGYIGYSEKSYKSREGCEALSAPHLIVLVKHFIDPMDYRVRQIIVILCVIAVDVYGQPVPFFRNS